MARSRRSCWSARESWTWTNRSRRIRQDLAAALSDSAVFQPLGMRETTYGWNPAMDPSRFAVGHDTNGVALDTAKRTMARASAADWLVTTIGDYSRFAEYVLNGAGLSPAVFTAMMTRQVTFEELPNQGMGLGWEVIDGSPGAERMILHTGSDDGIKTMILLLLASKRGLVMFTTGDRGMDVMLHIARAALQINDLTP
jgi:CubicO group peptidase (beta-lactamase class C family)